MLVVEVRGEGAAGSLVDLELKFCVCCFEECMIVVCCLSRFLSVGLYFNIVLCLTLCVVGLFVCVCPLRTSELVTF